jgi:hypothetical protein
MVGLTASQGSAKLVQKSFVEMCEVPHTLTCGSPLVLDMLAARWGCVGDVATSLAIDGVAKNEIATQVVATHAASDVAGTCHFPCATLRVEYRPSS